MERRFPSCSATVLTGERTDISSISARMADLAKALQEAYVYEASTRVSRPEHGRPPRLCGDRFLGYLQTHDQVGNRAKGERRRS